MKIKDTKKIVEAVLSEIPETRSCDNLLILEVLRFIDPNVIDMPFKKVIAECTENGKYPAFETIRRTRQKVQAENPYLKATDKVEHMRQFQEHKFFEFAIK